MKIQIHKLPPIRDKSLIQIESKQGTTWLTEQSEKEIIQYRLNASSDDDGLMLLESKYLKLFTQPTIKTTTRNIVIEEGDIQLKVNYLTDKVDIRIEQPDKHLFSIEKDKLHLCEIPEPEKCLVVLSSDGERVTIASFTDIEIYESEILNTEGTVENFDFAFNSLKALNKITQTTSDMVSFFQYKNNNLLISTEDIKIILRALDIPIPDYKKVIKEVETQNTETVELDTEHLLKGLEVCEGISDEVEIRLNKNTVSLSASNEIAKFGPYEFQTINGSVDKRKKITLNTKKILTAIKFFSNKTDKVQLQTSYNNPILIRANNTKYILATIGKVEVEDEQ